MPYNLDDLFLEIQDTISTFPITAEDSVINLFELTAKSIQLTIDNLQKNITHYTNEEIAAAHAKLIHLARVLYNPQSVTFFAMQATPDIHPLHSVFIKRQQQIDPTINLNNAAMFFNAAPMSPLKITLESSSITAIQDLDAALMSIKAGQSLLNDLPTPLSPEFADRLIRVTALLEGTIKGSAILVRQLRDEPTNVLGKREREESAAEPPHKLARLC